MFRHLPLNRRDRELRGVPRYLGFADVVEDRDDGPTTRQDVQILPTDIELQEVSRDNQDRMAAIH
jgi:hypothetical protein